METIFEYLVEHLNLVTLIAGLICTIGIALVYYLYSKSRTLLSYVPNVWTSLGILGTFVAIVNTLESADIYGADKMVDMSKLIGNIVPAFTTSIIGIVGAIISSLGIKVIFAVEDEKYDVKNLCKSSYGLTPELMLDGILRNTKETKESLDGIAQKIAEGILEETNKSISEKVYALLEEHGKIITGVFEKESELLKSTVGSLSQGVKENTERIVAEYKNLTEDLKNALAEQVSTYKSETSKNTSDLVSQIAVKQKEISDAYIESLKTIHQTAAQSAAELQDSISQRFETFTNNLVEECEKLQNSIIDAAVTDGKAIIDGIKQHSDAVMSEYKDLTASISQGTQQFADSMVLLSKETAKSFETNLNEGVSRVSGELINASQHLISISNDFGPVADRIATAMTDYNAVMVSAQNIIKSLDAAERKLADVINAHDPSDEQLKKALESMEKLSETLYVLNYRIEAMRHGDSGDSHEHAIKCPHCGTESTNPMANFCRNCGHSL